MACSIHGCEKPYRAKGFCPMHWHRNHKYGSPEKQERVKAPMETRFWAKVKKTGSCWIWIGAKSNGYGHLNLCNGRFEKAHRISFMISNGLSSLPKNKVIDHLCRNPSCVNPKHLELVTHRTNLIRGFSPTVKIYKTKHALVGTT